MSDQDSRNLLALDMIAAVAAKLAADIRARALWPGDLQRRMQNIHECLRDVKEAR